MIKAVHIETMAPGTTSGFRYRIEQGENKIKALIVTGKNVEVTIGKSKLPEILFTSIGAARGYTAPDSRLVNVKSDFETNDHLLFTIRNHNSQSQRVTVCLIIDKMQSKKIQETASSAAVKR